MIEIFRSAPIASAIMAMTIFISLYTIYRKSSFMHELMLHPYSFARGERRYTILTSGFIHADFQHLLFNMLSFYFVAFSLENRLGHWQFFLLYFAGLLLSDISTLIKRRNDRSYYSLGASGAVSAVIFSFVLFSPFSKFYFLFIPFGIPAWLFAILYLVYCIYASGNKADYINHEAHLYGSLTGVVMTLILHPYLFQSLLNRLF